MSEIDEEVQKKEQEQHEEDIKLMEKWGVVYNFPDPFLQRDIQKFQTRLKKLGGTGEIATSVYKGLIVRVALELDWISGELLKNITTMLPGQVSHISAVIFTDTVVAQQIPNE